MINGDSFKSKLEEKIKLAKKLSAGAENEKEVFTAILTVELIKAQDSITPVSQKRFEKSLSIKEFLIQKKPKGDVERTAAFGYYLENFDAKEFFTSKDIISCFQKAKEPIPGNPYDKIQKCIAKGWIMESDKKKNGEKSYTMTGSGIEAVEKGFAAK